MARAATSNTLQNLPNSQEKTARHPYDLSCYGPTFYRITVNSLAPFALYLLEMTRFPGLTYQREKINTF